MAKYMVWEGFIEDLDKRMHTIEKKCRKYGVEFHYELTGAEEYREVKDDADEVHTLRYVEVDAEGTAQVNGWEWLASIERTEKGNLILSNRDVKVPTKYYTSDCYCEHCQTKRWRKYLYLVRNTETGEIKQVGESCLRDYTHGLSAEAVTFYRSLFTGFEEAEERIPSFGGGFSQVEYFDTDEITRFMSETIRHFGFVPTSDDSKISTAVRARDFYDVAHGRKRCFLYDMDRFYKVEREMKEIGFNADSPEAVKEAKDALAWIAEQDDTDSSYMHNLKLTCGMKEIKGWHYGIVASLIPTWNKSLVREAERKAKQAAEANSKHVGKVGERITFDVASTKVVTSWETDYGMMWLVKFISTEGNVFMWRASSLNALPDDFELIKKVTGTVKDHDEFRGIKQTFVNRCKVVELLEKKHAPYDSTNEDALNEAIKALA